MRATRLPLRAVPLREETLQPVSGKVSERLREALRGFTSRLRASKPQPCTANLCTNIVDLRGCDSSIILVLRGGIPRPMGYFLESLSQAILARMILVGRLGVGSLPEIISISPGALQGLHGWTFGILTITHIYIYIHTHCLFVVYIYIYIYTHISVIYTSLSLYLSIYIYIYIYIYTHVFVSHQGLSRGSAVGRLAPPGEARIFPPRIHRCIYIYIYI